MKTKDMQTGVLYAYQPDKRMRPQPVVVVSETFCHAARHNRLANPGRAFIAPARPDLPKRCSVGRYEDLHWGYPAVTNLHPQASLRFTYPAAAPRDLLAVTDDEVFAATYEDRHDELPGHTGAYPLVIDPKHLLGPWEEEIEKWDAAQEVAANLRDAAATEKKQADQAQTARYQRLRDLGIPGPFPDRFYSDRDRSHVTLSNAQFETLLALIPDGVTVEESWEYPEGQR